MYNYDFKENDEHIITESIHKTIEVNQKKMLVSVVVTNKNLLLFKNINEKNVLNSRGMSMPEEYELIFKLPIKQIEYKIEDNKTIISYNENLLIIEHFNLDLAK